MSSRSNAAFLVAVIALSFAPMTRAQLSSETEPPAQIAGAIGPGMQAKAGLVTMRMENMDVAPVKGSPFCATVNTEHTQVFADGNRIHTNENSTVCRDSEGRTRREAQLNLLGAVQQSTPQKIITIVDPVAGFRYILDTNTKTAHKMPLPPEEGAASSAAKSGKNLFFYSSTIGAGPAPGGPGAQVFISRAAASGNEPAPASENLGDQTIAGVQATGTRITTTIPAGKMGNEQPINVVSESWYSPELKATVMSKHSDPWAGQLTTEFTNVSTSEPDPSLFTIPSDYKIVDGPQPLMMKIQPPMPPPPQ
ncbi:MAG TPA: hypothetical protein VMU61_15980 [Candidatus Aquilonibacter sp.]|nr:hypothetical protein [Candidatus Aquilonibacter sp.]